jgi:hypothetical protein
MGSLSDFFPDNFKDDFANRSIKVGAVIRKFVTNTTPPKEKRFIVVGLSDDSIALAVVYINTEINPFIANRPDLNRLQLELKQKNRSILNYDSFVDCTKIFEFKFEDVQKHLAENPQELLGEIDGFEHLSIIERIRLSKQISKAQLRKFGLD